jgi:proteasome lid subunit RPN8/RPN11
MDEFKIIKSHLDKMIVDAVKNAVKGGMEICGLLVNNGYFIELIKVKNKKKKGGGFEFYHKEIKSIEVAAKILRHEIVGTFHSHPAYIAVPSGSDVAHAIDDSLMLIIDVSDKKAALWHVKGQEKREVKFTLLE